MKSTLKSAQITSNMVVSVISAGPDYDLENAVWAINWFDVKSKWLYDFYNVLAFPHVKKVGAKPFFKGRLKKRLVGEAEDEREVFLMVMYPKPEKFLDMLRIKAFQLKSIIRELAVEDFTFGFMKRLDDGDPPGNRVKKYDGKLIYLVHHFKNNHQRIDTKGIKELVASMDIFVHFSGIKSALVGRRKSGKKLKTAPFLMDGLLVLGAFESSQFDDLLATDFYKNFIDKNQSNYIGLFLREF